jgi:hypothetical protein
MQTGAYLPAPQDVVTAPLIETPAKRLSSGPKEGDIQDRASELRRIPLPRTPVNKGTKKGRGCSRPRPPPCERLRSDHERVDLLAPAKVTLVELELPVGGLVDLPAPLGTTV